MRARPIGSFLLMFALAIPALAQERRGASSLDRVLPHIRQAVPGTFYDAEGPFFGPNGHPTYRLKWMTPDGRIIWFSVDAQTGQLIGAVPGGPPPGRYRNDNGNRGLWDAPRNNWRSDDGNNSQGGWGRGSGSDNGNNRGNGWGSGQGDHRGNGWGNNGDSRGNGDDRGQGGSWGGGDNRGGDNRGGDNRGGGKERHRR